jgi:anti-sigma regulatory factor (Ser/Thr protein kinase)
MHVVPYVASARVGGGGGDLGTVMVRHTASSAGLVRRQLVADLDALGLDGETIENAALLASELVGNAVRYAHPLPGDLLRVEWTLEDGRLMIRVTDGGGRQAPHVRSAGPADTSGRGMAIVDALAAAWGVDRIDGPDFTATQSEADTEPAGLSGASTVWAQLPAARAGGQQPGVARASNGKH